MEKILHMLVGLPRSGKSTLSKQLGYPIVEPDAIRSAIHGPHFIDASEPLIWGIAHTMVESLFLAGHENVILDATNHTAERRRLWESPRWCVKYHIVDTNEAVCVKRAIESDQEYLIPVINRMAANLVWPDSGSDC